jgi:hypothetical protein
MTGQGKAVQKLKERTGAGPGLIDRLLGKKLTN